MTDFSIIIPVFNSELYIPKLISSLKKQDSDFLTFEVIFIDDGSTDGSVQALKKEANGILNYKIILQENLKQSAARNKGLVAAKGKYLLFIDSDDYLHPGTLDKYLEAMEGGAELAVSDIRKIFPENSLVEKNNFKQFVHSGKLLESYLTKNCEADVGLWNKCFDAKKIQENNLTFHNENFFEDSLFVFQYLSICDPQKISLVDSITYDLFKNEGSTTRLFRPEIAQLAENYVKQVEQISKLLKISKGVVRAFRTRTYIHVVHHYINYHNNLNVSEIKEISRRNIFILESIDQLSLKYFTSAVLIRCFPRIYSYLYRNHGN